MNKSLLTSNELVLHTYTTSEKFGHNDLFIISIIIIIILCTFYIE